jgi:tRNA pseudouridine55 synthase
MSRRRGRNVHGVVLLDKPAGLSSNQALQQVRRLFDARKAGHTGSLDPLATGMLPICLGEASKTAGLMLDADKRYIASLRLGAMTATGDAEGEITRRCGIPDLEPSRIESVLASFRGEITQIPPMYSALKRDGKPLYELARQGKEVEREPRQVMIYELKLLHWSSPDIRFDVICSKGTYVRTLGEDIAGRLQSCGHLVALRRISVGPFDPDAMVTLETLELAARDGGLERFLLPPDAGLVDWPVVSLDQTAAARFRHGNPVQIESEFTGAVRVYDPAGILLGLGEVASEGRLKPSRVFLLE